MRTRTQDDLVSQDMGYQATEETRYVKLPGIEQLHTKSVAEIAEVLANVLKSEARISKLTWEVGKGIELTIPNSPFQP